MRLLRLFLAFGALWSYGAFVGASTARCDITYPDPLEVATAYGLTPHPTASSLTPIEVIDPCPFASGAPRIKHGFYFSVSTTWPSADEIRFAEQCYKTACTLFEHSKGENPTLIEGALKYARTAQYYGLSDACYLMRSYYLYQNVDIPEKGHDRKRISFRDSKPNYELASVADRMLRGYGRISHARAFSANARRLHNAEPLIERKLQNCLARVFADIYKEEQRTRDRVAAKASAELSESKDDAADGKDIAESAPADVDDVVLTDADDAEKEHLLKAETDGTRHRSVAAAASAYTHLM